MNGAAPQLIPPLFGNEDGGAVKMIKKHTMW
jgi:hypothetical protein